MKFVANLAWLALPALAGCGIVSQVPSRGAGTHSREKATLSSVMRNLNQFRRRAVATGLVTVQLLALSSIAQAHQQPFGADALLALTGPKSPTGLSMKRREVPFGTVRAARMTVTYQGDIQPVVAKHGNGAIFFLQPASDNGWSQKVHDIQVQVDGKSYQPNMKDWLGRPAYVIPVDASSKNFYARVEFTQFDRVIRKNDVNPNPITLSKADIEKYTADYTVVKGIVDGKNKAALGQAGLLRRAGESEWDFVQRVMQDCISNRRWRYSEQKAEWPKNPTQWLQGANVGNCVDINTYFIWLLRESGIPSRYVSSSVPTNNGQYRGHGSVEFFSTHHGAWIPADLTALVSSGASTVGTTIGHDLVSNVPLLSTRFLGSDDRSYYFYSSPSGNIDVVYGAMPMFAAPRWGRATVSVGNAPVFSQPIPVKIID